MTSQIAPSPLPDVEVGMEWGPAEVEVTELLNEQFLFAMEDYGADYLPGGDTPPRAHPGTLLSLAMSGVIGFNPAPGWTGMHARDEVELVSPVRVGESLTLHWRVVDIYEKRGRPWWVRECEITGSDGAVRLRRRIHTAFQRDVTERSSGARPRADATSAEQTGAEAARCGRWKDITLPRLLTFSPHTLDSPNWPPVNHHTSRELAARAGLRAPIAAGTQTESHVLAMLADLVGPQWWRSGTLDLRFLSPVYEGDRIRACARAKASSAPDAQDYEVWCERADASKVAVGTARLGDRPDGR